MSNRTVVKMQPCLMPVHIFLLFSSILPSRIWFSYRLYINSKERENEKLPRAEATEFLSKRTIDREYER